MKNRIDWNQIKDQVKMKDLIFYIETILGISPTWRGENRAMFYSPLRQENNPSFYVYRLGDYWYWTDFGTGEKGDIINLIEILFGLSFKEALQRLAEEDGVGPLELTMDPTRAEEIEKRRKESQAKARAELIEKVKWIRNLHRDLKRNTSRKELLRVFKHFGLPYHPEMECVIFRSFREKTTYLCTPLPHPKKMLGLELRSIPREGEEKKRKTWGIKTLWVLKRESDTALITESVFDSLAAEVVLSDARSWTLVSLNGVGNVSKLEKLLVQNPQIKKLVLALDLDEAGERARGEAEKIILAAGRRVEHIRDFGGEKDFFRQLKKKKRQQCRG